MVSKKTTYVIGASASKEANLPVGSELKDKIARLLDIKYDFHQVSGDHLIEKAVNAK